MIRGSSMFVTARNSKKPTRPWDSARIMPRERLKLIRENLAGYPRVTVSSGVSMCLTAHKAPRSAQCFWVMRVVAGPPRFEPGANGSSEKNYVADSSSLWLRHRPRFWGYCGLERFPNLNLETNLKFVSRRTSNGRWGALFTTRPRL